MWLRRILVLAIVATGAFLLYGTVWRPHHCNVTKGHARRALDTATEQLDPYIARVTGLENLELLEECFRRDPHDPELIILMGESLEAAGRIAAAREIYCAGIEMNRSDTRLYLACGNTQLLSGQKEEAMRYFLHVGEFSGPAVLRSIADAEVRREAIRIIGKRHEQKLAAFGAQKATELASNGGFIHAAVEGPRVSTEMAGSRTSAAESWMMRNVEGGSITTLLTRSRRTSGNALYVSTTAAGAGISQPLTRRTARVRVSASLLVRRGTACLGSNNGHDFLTTVCTKRTGVWERLETINESCPARQIAILARSSEGADFFVDEVTASETFSAPPCER